VLGVLLMALVAGGLVWRQVSRRRHLPCPSWAIALLENPYMAAVAGAELLLNRAGVEPGMGVLDVGSGPGRLTIPAADRVGPHGAVTALEIQPEMVEILERRLREQQADNVEVVLGGIGEGLLAHGAFDRVFLVTVLGEILDKQSALAEIHDLLRPGGILSVTEVLPDPHYQRRKTVEALASKAGLTLHSAFGSWPAFTLNFERPRGA
jgi:ubiquinone/menaquinone biosynthesis C-methylase UbiE